MVTVDVVPVGSYFACDASYSHMYTDAHPSRSARQQPPPTSAVAVPPSMIFTGRHQMQLLGSAMKTAANNTFQPFPGSSHAVSIAALHSCRFAHMQGSVLNRMSSASAGAGSSGGGFPVNMSSCWLCPSAHGPQNSVADTHIHSMFLARVLVGDYTAGKSVYRKPPPCDAADPYGRCYDSCVNDVSNPSIFVIFHNSQCYPEYLIDYTNKPRDAAAV